MNGQKMGSFETNGISLFSVQGPSNELTMVRLVLDISETVIATYMLRLAPSGITGNPINQHHHSR